MNQRVLLTIARYVSIIFTPFYLPLMGQIALFALSYMRMLPLTYKLTVLLLIYTCTVMAPTYLIRIYRHYQGWHIWHVFSREERMVPYVISIACYFLCFYLLNLLHVPYFMSSIVVAAIAVQILCALTNNFWKISTPRQPSEARWAAWSPSPSSSASIRSGGPASSSSWPA